MELLDYYYSCDIAKSARNHISLENPRKAWCATPVDAYMANLNRTFISYQVNYYSEFRDDFTEGCLLH